MNLLLVTALTVNLMASGLTYDQFLKYNDASKMAIIVKTVYKIEADTGKKYNIDDLKIGYIINQIGKDAKKNSNIYVLIHKFLKGMSNGK